MLGGMVRVEPGVMEVGVSSMRSCSMAVRGRRGVARALGWMEATPLRVAKARLPSWRRQAAGWPPLLHSEMVMPSAVV